MAKTHPHLDQPTGDQIRATLGERNEAVIETAVALHELITRTLPDVQSSIDLTDGQIGYAARQWGYNGWGMAAVSPYSKWVNLHLMAADRLDDPKKLLSEGKHMRHIKFAKPDEVTAVQAALVALLEQAAELNQQ